MKGAGLSLIIKNSTTPVIWPGMEHTHARLDLGVYRNPHRWGHCERGAGSLESPLCGFLSSRGKGGKGEGRREKRDEVCLDKATSFFLLFLQLTFSLNT